MYVAVACSARLWVTKVEVKSPTVLIRVQARLRTSRHRHRAFSANWIRAVGGYTVPPALWMELETHCAFSQCGVLLSIYRRATNSTIVARRLALNVLIFLIAVSPNSHALIRGICWQALVRV